MEQDPITPIPETTEWRISKWEHSLTYQTTDGVRKEMAVEHIPGVERKVTFSAFSPGQEEPTAVVELSVEETRLRKDFLDRVDSLGLLDHS